MKKSKVIIVDPFSTGALIAPLLSKAGFECYAVQSSPQVGRKFTESYSAEGFADTKLYSPAEIHQKITASEVLAVLTGFESGVYCAEKLAFDYQVPGNHWQTSTQRREKSAMQASLAKAKLHHIKTHKVSQDKTDLGDLDSPSGYVLKPDHAWGTEDVRFYATKEELEQAIRMIDWGKANQSGTVNDFYLVQERLEGEEFAVDLMVNGRDQRVCSICRYKKAPHNGSQFVYESLDVLDPHDPEYQKITGYAKLCAEALGVEWGPAHLEIMNTEKGPILIELAARLHGGIAPTVFDNSYSPSLLDSLLCLIKGGFSADPVEQTRRARIVFLFNEKADAVLQDPRGLADRFNAMSSCLTAVIYIRPSDTVPLTTDLVNIPGVVALLADSDSQLDQAETEVRRLFDEALT